MFDFSVGLVALVLAIVFPALYWVGFQIKRVGAWSMREEGPKDRVGFFLIVLAILGFVIGCFAQPQWDKVMACKASGEPMGTCLFFSAANNPDRG